MQTPLITEDAAHAREQLAAYNRQLTRRDDPEYRAIGSLPPIIVKFPLEFRVVDLAALAARAGYRIRWIRRGKGNHHE